MDIIHATGIRLAAAIRTGEVTATHVVETHLARIEDRNPALNAVVTLGAEGALRRAREADEALDRGEIWGPLHGVPFTLKDSLQTAGMRTTAGFPPLADHVPSEDATAAARLKAAGGILMGKTNLPLLAGGFQTGNPLFGRTNNPWNPERTPGGSSGGSAAALAAGMTPFEVGSDMGGSLRIPAHFCGTYALKPTEHRVSLFGHIPDLPGSPRLMRVMGTIGPLARDIDDLALLYALIAGPDGHDTDVPPVPIEPVPTLERHDVRLALADTFPGFPVGNETRASIRELSGTLRGAGVSIEEAPLPDLDYDRPSLFVPARLAMAAGQGDPKEAPVPLLRYLEALDRRDSFITAWEQFFTTYDALICPVSMTTAFPHRPQEDTLRIDGEDVDYWLAGAHCLLFNYTGHPAMALPYTLDADGLPLGYQLVGKRWNEAKLLAIAKLLSTITRSADESPRP